MVTPRGGCATLANQRTEPAPANVCQPRQRIARAAVITEIDDERTSLHRALIDEAPIAGVGRVVSIVTQHEILAHGNAQWTPGIARRMIAPPLILRPQEILALPVELGIEAVVQWIDALHIRLLQRATIRVNLPLAHLHDVSRLADDAFDVAPRQILRVRKGHHITAVRRLEGRRARTGARNLRAVDGFIDEQEIPREQRTLHTA